MIKPQVGLQNKRWTYSETHGIQGKIELHLIFACPPDMCNKKMQHSCGVTHSIALSYQFQNTTILVNLFQLGLHQI